MLARTVMVLSLKIFRGLTVIAVACVLANLAFVVDSAGAKECTLKRLGSADLTIRDNRLMVQVTVNGHPASMELDTSSAVTVIGSSYSKPFDLRAYPSNNVKIYLGGQVLDQVIPVTTFAVGSQQFGKSKFWVLPGSTQPREIGDLGRLGMDMLAGADFELDFAHNRLTFYAQDHCPGTVVYWTNNYSSVPMTRGPIGVYSFPIELEGKTMQAKISTALASTTISTEVTRSLFGFDEKSSGVTTETDSAGSPVEYYRAMTLAGDGIRIENAKIRLDPGPPDRFILCTNGAPAPAGVTLAGGYTACEGREPALYLGLNIARRLHLYFATKERVLYFSDAAASK